MDVLVYSDCPLGLQWECMYLPHFIINVKDNIIIVGSFHLRVFYRTKTCRFNLFLSRNERETLSSYNSTSIAAVVKLDSGCMFYPKRSDSGFRLPCCLDWSCFVSFFFFSSSSSFCFFLCLSKPESDDWYSIQRWRVDREHVFPWWG